jgi:hypothetical protein
MDSLLKHLIFKKIGEEVTKDEEEEVNNHWKETERLWNMKEKALYRNLWRTRYGRGHGDVANQTTEMRLMKSKNHFVILSHFCCNKVKEYNKNCAAGC